MSNTSLVIGSTGLIGKRLLFELAKKPAEVIAITRRPINNLPEKNNIKNNHKIIKILFLKNETKKIIGGKITIILDDLGKTSFQKPINWVKVALNVAANLGLVVAISERWLFKKE